MTRPYELSQGYPMEIHGGKLSDTNTVWEVLAASKIGDLGRLKALIEGCPELLYAQYNYTPPIHFAVREGHLPVVRFLLERGAYDPAYRTYPFLDSLETIAREQGYTQIYDLLTGYTADEANVRYRGDNGRIIHPRSNREEAFEQAVDRNDIAGVRSMLEQHPDLVKNTTYFWGEGILMMPAKEAHFEMIDLLLAAGAHVPKVLKWTKEYYFKREDAARYMMSKGMSARVKSWQEVTLLHDMAFTGQIQKAQLLLDNGADVDAIDDEYLSTPLGYAARWGHVEIVKLLLERGADRELAGADWAKPLHWAQSRGHEAIARLLEQ